MRDLLDDSDVPADSLSRVFVETTHTKEGFACLDDLLQEGRTQNHGWGMPLLGPPRCGKTSFVVEYLRICNEGVGGRRPLRYFYVEMNKDTKPASIAYQTLHEANDPNPGFGNPAQRTERALDAIRRWKPDVIIYDEAHYLVDSDTQKVQGDGVAWFNGLLNEIKCPLLLIGYERMERVIKRDDNTSLGGRMMPFPKFRPFDVTDPESAGEFRFVLENLEPQLGLAMPSGLADPDTATRICIVCQGRLGFLELFLVKARQLARRKGNSCLTRDTLSAAAAAVAPMWDHDSLNPFAIEDLGEAIERYRRKSGPRPTKAVPAKKGAAR